MNWVYLRKVIDRIAPHVLALHCLPAEGARRSIRLATGNLCISDKYVSRDRDFGSCYLNSDSSNRGAWLKYCQSDDTRDQTKESVGIILLFFYNNSLEASGVDYQSFSIDGYGTTENWLKLWMSCTVDQKHEILVRAFSYSDI